ncbi:Uncharacterised protein at_DN1793 [Pycnogonum litorale]
MFPLLDVFLTLSSTTAKRCIIAINKLIANFLNRRLGTELPSEQSSCHGQLDIYVWYVGGLESCLTGYRDEANAAYITNHFNSYYFYFRLSPNNVKHQLINFTISLIFSSIPP